VAKTVDGQGKNIGPITHFFEGGVCFFLGVIRVLCREIDWRSKEESGISFSANCVLLERCQWIPRGSIRNRLSYVTCIQLEKPCFSQTALVVMANETRWIKRQEEEMVWR